MSQDPRDMLANGPMTPVQILVVAITVGLTALDGFDVLSISFAAPGIARDWRIDRAALGVVLSVVAAWRYLDYKMKSGSKIESINFDGPAIAAVLHW